MSLEKLGKSTQTKATICESNVSTPTESYKDIRSSGLIIQGLKLITYG